MCAETGSAWLPLILRCPTGSCNFTSTQRCKNAHLCHELKGLLDAVLIDRRTRLDGGLDSSPGG